MMKTKKIWLSLGCVAFLLMASFQSYAGGPLILRAPGAPFLWPNGGVNIPFNPDQGGLGPLTNAQAVAQTTAAFAAWQAIPSASATHFNAGALPVDVDETNFVLFLSGVPDGLSPIVYDDDGAIFDLIFGPDSGVLGFAGPDIVDVNTGAILEGLAFMNGGALLPPNPFPVAEMLSVQVHEFGHYQNLAHTVVNGQILVGPDSTGPSPFNTFPRPPSFANRIETMYPFLFINGGQATPHKDDIAIFSHLYPEPTFATSTGTITGNIIAPNNRTPVTGVNVIARNIANPFEDAVSAISSDFTDNFTPGQPFVGVYTIRGLTPGASYAVFVDEILAGGFSTPPRSPLPGPEEFYNGSGESNDFFADDPSVFTPIVASAGTTAGGINIIFNRLPPGPIPIGLDESFEIFPRFRFGFCGQKFESVFINTSGNLTFGTGDPFGFVESIARHLTGPPRIAGLWDDLNPEAGGVVSFSETSNSLTITFTNVPEFPATGANTFSFTLFAASGDDDGDDDSDSGGDSRFTIKYGDLSAPDGLAGYSCGGRITSGFELEQDLSGLSQQTINGQGQTAIFEAFSGLSNDLNDLDNRTLRFLGPGAFHDQFEPNNSLGAGDLVQLPFNTANQFSDINPLGNDVDFYRFRARAGEIIVIETVPGLTSMDTLIGLFDANGNLLALDDDSGSTGGVGFGGLSRLAFIAPANGTYAAAVTTFPDFGFTGAGGDFGRYVLNISTYRGTLLPLIDDESVQIPLTTFTFPFQGTNWSSVFVNGNGYLTFGNADNDPLNFLESVPKFLAGPPRIAALWDDLFPGNGLVIAEEKNRSLHIHFVTVPEFFTDGPNYFTVVLDRGGDITIDYGATNRSDALVGVTQGGGAADPGPTDLSNASSLSAVGTTYERFPLVIGSDGFVSSGSFRTYGGVDLSFTTLKFKKN